MAKRKSKKSAARKAPAAKPSSKKFHHMHPVSFGVALGIIWALGLAIITYASMRSGFLGDLFALLVGMYPGYAVSWKGIFSGLVFGFIDGFIGGWIFAWLYNKCVDKWA